MVLVLLAFRGCWGHEVRRDLWSCKSVAFVSCTFEIYDDFYMTHHMLNLHPLFRRCLHDVCSHQDPLVQRIVQRMHRVARVPNVGHAEPLQVLTGRCWTFHVKCQKIQIQRRLLIGFQLVQKNLQMCRMFFFLYFSYKPTSQILCFEGHAAPCQVGRYQEGQFYQTHFDSEVMQERVVVVFRSIADRYFIVALAAVFRPKVRRFFSTTKKECVVSIIFGGHFTLGCSPCFRQGLPYKTSRSDLNVSITTPWVNFTWIKKQQ